jgi:hypothetical protein
MPLLRSVKLITPLSPLARLRMSGAVFLLPIRLHGVLLNLAKGQLYVYLPHLVAQGAELIKNFNMSMPTTAAARSKA